MGLASLMQWYLLITRNEQDASQKYIDLAPTDEADEFGIYSEALIHATSNDRVSNIALTGPYGSGKSSVIKTFLKRYKGQELEISLAAFLPEADGSVNTSDSSVGSGQEGGVSKQEIERSILQQMLYGADANSLPLSRFKRIQSPKWWSWIVSLFILLGVFSCWHIFQERSEIVSGKFFDPLDFTNWLNITSFVIGLSFLWLSLHQLYVKSLGISLKSISLKNLEITPEKAHEESILNRHLDEIIYFFQSTKYDLVIIEDLDRFNNPEIFVTLREINSLVNANAGVKRKIRFLYALRDNMFVNTDRTKFFEFIVPVIPIINSSNSIDKVIEQGERLSLDKRLDRQFLREVSRYLNDLRLIQNIFNEYAVYVANLETDGESILDANKLLAIMIYKNVLPSDFEALHREQGALAEILHRHDEFITEAESFHKSQITQIEREIGAAQKQLPADLSELRQIYAMALVDSAPRGCSDVGLNQSQKVSIKNISSNEQFEDLIKADRLFSWNMQGHLSHFNFDGQRAYKAYQERKEHTERMSDEFKAEAAKRLKELRTKISTLRTSKFHEIIRINAESAEELFDAFGENRELVRFLVLEGYLDDTYYQYTSLFHSGRLSPSDNKYLIQIRSFKIPEPDFQIDNPKEVIAAMRADDFRQEYVLNKALVDCMLLNKSVYDTQIAKLVSFISSNFDACDAFFSSYYERGKCVPELLSTLIERWSGFVAAALSSSDNVTHVARMIAHLPEEHLETLTDKDPEVSVFLSTNLSEILSLGIDFAPTRLELLQFEAKDLQSIEKYPAIARLLSDKGLYEISIENLEFIFREVLGSAAMGELQSKHYSTVLNSGEDALIDKVEDNFDVYLGTVLLQLEKNTGEDVSAIIKAINHDEIESRYLEQFIEQQAAKLHSLDEIPTRLHSVVFRQRKIEASWDNCLAYMASKDFDLTTLTAFLQHEETLSVLSTIAVDDNEVSKQLRSFLFSNNDFEADTYRAYIKMLPRQFGQFPTDIDPEKIQILIEEHAVSFSSDSFSFLDEYEALQVLFVATNMETYFGASDEYEIDDNFRQELLESDIGDEHKIKIIEEMDLTALPGLQSRASIIGQILHRTGVEVQLTADAAQAMIIHSNPIATQISLFNKYRKTLSVAQIRATISKLPWPFSKITPSWEQPKIPNTPENRDFVRWLEAKSIISSSKPANFDRKIRIYNKRP